MKLSTLIGIGALCLAAFSGSAEGKSHPDLLLGHVPREQDAQDTPRHDDLEDINTASDFLRRTEKSKKEPVCHLSKDSVDTCVLMYHTIEVGAKAAKAHLKNGDFIGKCSEVCDALCSKNNKDCQVYPSISNGAEDCWCNLNPLYTCGENTVCNNNVCECQTGYEGDPLVANGIGCTDIDECATTEGNDCVENAQCVNIAGSYFCVCDEGYGGDGKEAGDGCTALPSTSSDRIFYDEGCPCFNQADVDAFLTKAETAPYCYYEEYTYFRYTTWRLYTSHRLDSESMFVYDSVPGGSVADRCDKFDYEYDGSSSSTIVHSRKLAYLNKDYEGTTADCVALITGVRDTMASLDCAIREYTY